MNAELLKILGSDPEVMLERKHSGFLVQISRSEDNKRWILECETEREYRIAEIPVTEIMEAFNHPCLYVDDAASLFKSSSEFFDEIETENNDDDNRRPDGTPLDYERKRPYDQESDDTQYTL